MTESEFLAMVDISLPYGFEKYPTLDDYEVALNELRKQEATHSAITTAWRMPSIYDGGDLLYGRSPSPFSYTVDDLIREAHRRVQHMRDGFTRDEAKLVPPPNRGRLGD